MSPPERETIGTSISSASSQVAKARSPIRRRSQISPERTNGSGTCSSGRDRPAVSLISRAIWL
jgi:hypothetical protein